MIVDGPLRLFYGQKNLVGLRNYVSPHLSRQGFENRAGRI